MSLPATAPNENSGERLGERLLALGLISADQLQVALHEKRQRDELLGAILVRLGFLDEETLVSVLAERSGLHRVDLAQSVIDPALIQRLPQEVARRCRVLPIHLAPGRLELAMTDTADVLAMDEVQRHFPDAPTILPRLASERELAAAIDHYYGFVTSVEGVLRELEGGVADLGALENQALRTEHPVVRLVNALLFEAVSMGASDLHFEPEPGFVRLRYRLDGVLHQIRALHRDHWPALAHRLKIIAGMNIADPLRPQDGRLTLSVAGEAVDFRVSLLPTVHGDNIVIRILDHRRAILPLAALGFSDGVIDITRRMLQRPEGIVIITGPTGSGKTTTLYALLREISSPELNIMTLEDPVEYRIPLLRQTQVRETSGLGFADGIRSMLRQDPDIIFVGEVRDSETAQMALRAAMTGHQVFTTLHTNDALGAVPRLVDFGLNPRLLAGNVIGVVAQRLVRKLCLACRQPVTATAEECRVLRVDPAEPPMLYRGVGCPACRQTGYRGRIAVAEVLRMSEALDELVATNASRASLMALARAQGYVPLAEDGLQRVRDGQTSLAALRRAVDLSGRG